MPETNVPLIPLSESTQFGEIMGIVELLVDRNPDQFVAGIFLFPIVPEPKWPAEQVQFPAEVDRVMIVCINTALGEVVVNTMKMIEHLDAKRLGVAPTVRPSPPFPREKLSFRQIYKWMNTAPATVLTYSLGEKVGEGLIGFLRTKETVENFNVELRRLSRATDSAN